MANHTAPLSPHLQIWRWTITMATSILQRATGIAMYAGSILLTLWLASAALGDSVYASMQGFMGSWFGQLILFGYSWAIFFHLLNGLRYLFWDAGIGFEKATATKTGWGAVLVSLALTALIWGNLVLSGGGN